MHLQITVHPSSHRDDLSQCISADAPTSHDWHRHGSAPDPPSTVWEETCCLRHHVMTMLKRPTGSTRGVAGGQHCQVEVADLKLPQHLPRRTARSFGVTPSKRTTSEFDDVTTCSNQPAQSRSTNPENLQPNEAGAEVLNPGKASQSSKTTGKKQASANSEKPTQERSKKPHHTLVQDDLSRNTPRIVHRDGSGNFQVAASVTHQAIRRQCARGRTGPSQRHQRRWKGKKPRTGISFWCGTPDQPHDLCVFLDSRPHGECAGKSSD